MCKGGKNKVLRVRFEFFEGVTAAIKLEREVGINLRASLCVLLKVLDYLFSGREATAFNSVLFIVCECVCVCLCRHVYALTKNLVQRKFWQCFYVSDLVKTRMR